jgi:hypothetical protein
VLHNAWSFQKFKATQIQVHGRGVPRNFVRVGGGGVVQQIQLRTEGRERGVEPPKPPSIRHWYMDFKDIRICLLAKVEFQFFVTNIIRNSKYSRGAEKLIVAKLVNKFPVFNGYRYLTTLFTGTGYWTLSCASLFQSTSC